MVVATYILVQIPVRSDRDFIVLENAFAIKGGCPGPTNCYCNKIHEYILTEYNHTVTFANIKRPPLSNKQAQLKSEFNLHQPRISHFTKFRWLK